ncbi:hypothetical protein BT93_B1842 [Corymbia citriodora subsp. variegata]|nr:hypothetical protein BT93_B1842 [Corymbia citriodora subsp. variegata]
MRQSSFLTCEQLCIHTFFLWSFSLLLLLESMTLNTPLRIRIIFTTRARNQSNQVRTRGVSLIIS